MSVKGCKIDTYYVKADHPYSMYKDSFTLHAPEDFKQHGPNEWKGYYGGYIITIIQRGVHSTITDNDIKIEPQPGYKKEEGITYAIPSKTVLAQKLDEHLNEVYD